tara:strand:- start:1217 stop:2116 length:900 start_codon:yes stop_codon:yes gene_type:complete
MLKYKKNLELDSISKKYLSAIYARGYANIPKMALEQTRAEFGYFTEASDFLQCGIENKIFKFKIFNSPSETKNLIIYLHGGAYVLRNDRQNDRVCSKLANKLNCNVLLLHYSLAPENKFPAAINEVSLFLNKIGSINTKIPKYENLYLFGESSGGNLAVASILNSNVKNLEGLILINSSLDYYGAHDSKIEFKSGYCLDDYVRKYFATHYINVEEDRKNPLVSPLLSDNLKLLPRSFIANSYFDPMRDEAFAFHNKLLDSKIDAELHCYNTIHNFINMNIRPYSEQCLDRINNFINHTA